MYIAGYQVRSLPPAPEALLLRQLRLRPGRYYSGPQLSAAVRDAFGTRAFRKITYSLLPASDSSARLVLDAERSPAARIGLGLNYNSFTGIGLIGSVTVQNKLAAASTSQVAFNIGENPRLRLKHVQYLTAHQRLVLRCWRRASGSASPPTARALRKPASTRRVTCWPTRSCFGCSTATGGRPGHPLRVRALRPRNCLAPPARRPYQPAQQLLILRRKYAECRGLPHPRPQNRGRVRLGVSAATVLPGAERHHGYRD
ncbi:MAG: hypothetical protein WKG07_42655 [Hymenobacter sp.]